MSLRFLDRGLIRRIHPRDDTKLIQTYNMLVSSCTNYRYLHYNEFLKYRDCILVTEPKDLRSNYPFAVLGVRRVYLIDLDIPDLPYHCTKEDTVYLIGFVHWFDPEGKFEYCKNEVLENMIEAALRDKNDSFCIIQKILCPETYTNDYLIDCGFKLIETGCVGGDYYIRAPRTR